MRVEGLGLSGPADIAEKVELGMSGFEAVVTWHSTCTFRSSKFSKNQ